MLIDSLEQPFTCWALMVEFSRLESLPHNNASENTCFCNPVNRFGFRGNPVIFISASPKVGDKQVRLTYLTSWIEKKLKEEFKVKH